MPTPDGGIRERGARSGGKFHCNQGGVWESIAKQYGSFGSPFVPCVEDVEIYDSIVAKLCSEQAQHRVAILGVTPAIVKLNWPSSTVITGVELSQPVIEALWSGDSGGSRRAICASWFDLPPVPGGYHLVMGDGSINTIGFPVEVKKLAGVIAARMACAAHFVVRCYVQPRVKESVDGLMRNTKGARRMSVDTFKFRLYLAMQSSSECGVAIKDAASILDDYGIDALTMKSDFGWSAAAIAPFAHWRHSSARYSFPSIEELTDVLDESFQLLSIRFPNYELGNCCPILTLRARR